MPQCPRRRVLRAVAATATTAVLAGCNDSVEPTNTGQRRDEGTTVTDYEMTTVREERVFAPFWLEEYENEANRPSQPVGGGLVTEPPSEGSVFFDPDADAAVSLRSFVADTDFQRECVYLWSTRVRGCETVQLRGVRRREDTIAVSLCGAGRPPTTACVEADRHTVALAVRLPFSGDEAAVNGVRWSSDCDDDPAPVTPIGGDDE